jgi:hypothetical protein
VRLITSASAATSVARPSALAYVEVTVKRETKPEYFRRDLLELVHGIHGKWTRAYTIGDCLGVERASRPENLLNFEPPAELAGSTQLTALWLEAQKCAQDVLDAVEQFCNDWNADGENVWWTYQNWPSSAGSDRLWTIAFVSTGEALARLAPDEAVQNASELMGQFKSTSGHLPSLTELIALERLRAAKVHNEQWLSKELRRRDGAGRPEGSTVLTNEEYRRNRDAAVRNGATTAAEIWCALGIDKKTYYRYEKRAKNAPSQK